MARESYNDLILQLGDLARERLANKANPPRTMEAAFAAEDDVLAIRDEKAVLEGQLNEEDGHYQDFLDQQMAEKTEQQQIVKKWKRAVEGIEARTRDLRKKISTAKATIRYEKVSLKRAEQRHTDMEQAEAHEVNKIALSRENLKKTRLQLMRKTRNIEDMESEFQTILTPKPGQPGAQGILAHKRLMEMEDEADERKADHDERMKELDGQIGAREEEEKDAEAALDEAIFALGEECYSERIPDPALSAMYPRIDKAK
jgi:hypothetical protein